jgi:hypothetical protein
LVCKYLQRQDLGFMLSLRDGGTGSPQTPSLHITIILLRLFEPSHDWPSNIIDRLISVTHSKLLFHVLSSDVAFSGVALYPVAAKGRLA